MARFAAEAPTGVAVQELEVLVRTALFKPATALVGDLLQGAANRIDAQYQSKPGEARKGREPLQVQCLFGTFKLQRDYYYHSGKKAGHYPSDAALGLEGSYTPGLARLICLEGADEASYLKAERHLEQTGGMAVSARQIQRMVQRVGSAAQQWQQRPAQAGDCNAPIMYVSADGTGVPMVPEALTGRRGKQADGTAKTRQVYLGCVFTQHKTDAEGVKVIASFTKLEPAVVSKILLPVFPTTIRPAGIEQTARLMVRHGLLQKVPDMKVLIYPTAPVAP